MIVEVTDDGVGGADATRGSGLRGLEDRVAALDGTLAVESPAGRGTRLRAEIPVRRFVVVAEAPRRQLALDLVDEVEVEVEQPAQEAR